MQRHVTIYSESVTPIKFCGETVMYHFGKIGVFELPFEVQPTTGKHDFNTCENCQAGLKNITQQLTERFEGNEKIKPFPFCCTYHANLTKLREFDRASYINVPEMAAKKIIYTNQHIVNSVNDKNWYQLITHYIEHVVSSFGQMPQHCGEPLFLKNYITAVTDSVQKSKALNKEQRNRILEFLNLYNTPANKQETDLNILINTYEKWFETFPFELNSYFGDLKEKFKKKLLIYNGIPEVNIYSGITKVKLHTKSSLIEALINLTNDVLTQINGVVLYEKGLLTEPQKTKLELILNERKMKLKQGYQNNSQDEEQRYRKILKEWFTDEKKFIDEITPILKEPRNKKTQRKFHAPAIALFCSLIHQSGILEKGFDESNVAYCKRICNRFELTYNDNIRQKFAPVMNIRESDKNLQEIIKEILPNLQIDIKLSLEKYISHKTKLYG